MLTRGRVVEPKEAIEKMASVNAKAVQAVAKELYEPGKICVSVAGPEMSEAKLQAAALLLGKG
jgi:predicted Zn-dependent peptidase